MTDEKKSSGTADKAPELTPEQAREQELATRDAQVGIDGVNPVTPNNPPRNSQPETSRPRD